jgi:histidinol-phosphate aminotransferase
VLSDPLDLATHAGDAAPPAWLRGRLERALDKLATGPDPRAAVRAVARRHDRDESDVLLTAGAADALVLLARVLRPRHAVVVHPSCSTADAALAGAGHEVHRLVLAPPYVLDPAQVPDAADLVVVGNPTDPTGVVHQRLPELCRPGRTVVVDEALDPGDGLSLARRADLPGLVVVRSLSSTWGLAGLRVGYLLAPAELVAALTPAQQPWPVGTLGLTALETCLARGPVKAAEKEAAVRAAERERLAAALVALGVEVVPSRAPYLLCRLPGRTDVPQVLAASGIRVAEVGPTPEHWRVTVRAGEQSDRLLLSLQP